MKLLDLFADRILDTPLFEMAVGRKKAISLIRNNSFPIFSNLIKSFIFDSKKQELWNNELNENIFTIQMIIFQPNHKYVEAKVYFELLFNENIPLLEKEIERLLNDPQYNKERRTNIDIQDLLKQIYIELTTDLGNFNFSGIEDYIEKYK